MSQQWIDRDPLIVALNEQSDVINSMITYTGNWYSLPLFLMARKYHAIQFDIKENLGECKKITMTFSKYPDIYLSDVRTEVQFNDLSLTMSINHWVTCNQLTGNYLIDYKIEYYIHTVKNFPVMIFFRINKSIKDHKQKLDAFINHILERETFINWYGEEPKAIETKGKSLVLHRRKNHDGKAVICCGLLLIMISTMGFLAITNSYDETDEDNNINIAPRIIYSSNVSQYFTNKIEKYIT